MRISITNENSIIIITSCIDQEFVYSHIDNSTYIDSATYIDRSICIDHSTYIDCSIYIDYSICVDYSILSMSSIDCS